MEKALTIVGRFWTSKKATRWSSSPSLKTSLYVLQSFLSSISNTVVQMDFQLTQRQAAKAFARSTPQAQSPPGLFPRNINCYEFDPSKGKLLMYLSSACEISFKDSSILRYTNRVKGTLSRGKLTDIEGIKTKVLVWVKVINVAVDSYKSDKVWFSAGVKKSRPKVAYEMPPEAIKINEN